MVDEELNNLQLDRPSLQWGKTNEQLAKHTVDSQFESKPIERSIHLLRKGDDIQKLSVIQALPQLLQYDPNGTLTRLVPKIQQELPKSSCEFHIATSKIFKLLIEKQLPLNLTGAVLQGTESKDPVVSNAWTETLLAVIPVLPIDQIKSNVIPLALTKSLPSSPVYCRVASCKIFGKCASHPKIESIDVKSTILPAVQSLCQDCFQDVRATMCSQLHFIAQGLGENLVKSSLLPSLVELASDDNVAVRSAAVAAAVLVIPFLNKQTKVETIVPLIKQLCQKPAGGVGDATFPTIAKEFGKLVDALKNDVEGNDCVWLLEFYKTLASRGHTVRVTKDNLEVTQEVLCRQQCAFNLPAVTLFTVTRIPNQLELWHTVFSGLANDSCYLVRKTAAACVYEVARILGANCKIIKDDFIKLLRDDAEEVLQMLVPHIGMTLELFCHNGVLSRDTTLSPSLEITRALLKCQMELSKSFNWRIKTNFLQQLELLPNCLPSDFIHQHFSPVVLNCVLEARPKPLRSQAARTLLIFLRYNLKEIQRKWIRDNLTTHLCYSKSCYTRHIFILACVHAMELFSNSYFKKHFFEPLLSLTDDPVSNIRLCVVNLLPSLHKILVLPEDRKFQTSIDNVFSKLEMVEKDKDVKDVLKTRLKEIKSVGPINKQEYLAEQKRKEEEELKIFQGKSGVTVTLSAASASNTKTHSTNVSREASSEKTKSNQSIARSTSAPSRGPKGGSGSGQIPSDMSFLEQHFYIDAGISLSRENLNLGLEKTNSIDICHVTEEKLNLHNESGIVPTLSVENVDIETMSENDLKKLEISTTNITDDVKVNLRNRNKRHASKIATPKAGSPFNDSMRGTDSTCKRYSTGFPASYAENCGDNSARARVLNRRSLNIGPAEMSKIPICLKKSKSNADVKNDEKSTSLPSSISVANEPGIGHHSEVGNGDNLLVKKTLNMKRPKSEQFTNIYESKSTSNSEKQGRPRSIINSSSNLETNSINSNVPIKINTKESTFKSSGLPVLKRRTLSEGKK